MKNALLICLLILSTAGMAAAQGNQSDPPEVVRVEAHAANGFAYPYYIYVPAKLRAAGQTKPRPILVIPNNTAKIDDNLAVHEEDVRRKIPQIGAVISRMDAILLMPVFPRPATENRIYTHSLDRDTMLTDREFRRLDLQLAAMIKDARARLARESVETEEKILMQGYSASGMFVNRFVFLHPKMVKAAVVGAPGGWAIAPLAKYKNKVLRYPIGTGDFKEVSGAKFDLEAVRRVPVFMLLGGRDTNDSVPVGDAYDPEDTELIFALFGKTPVERWAITKTLYEESKINAVFKLYPEATHASTKEMRDDILAFLARHAQ